jgi:hypothetical protein
VTLARGISTTNSQRLGDGNFKRERYGTSLLRSARDGDILAHSPPIPLIVDHIHTFESITGRKRRKPA